jgi:hemoglobin
MKSLYDRLGGEPAIMAAVADFYDRVIGDPLVAPFFASLDMKAQSRKQVAFMTWAFGGPTEYRGRDLSSAHAELVREKGLRDEHFDAVVLHLEQTLRDLGVAPDLVAEATNAVRGLRSKVFGRS